MKNIQISVTENNTIIVTADTERFGKSAVMFEGHSFMECCDYIRKRTNNNHFKLKALSCISTFTDTEGLTMPRSLTVVF